MEIPAQFLDIQTDLMILSLLLYAVGIQRLSKPILKQFVVSDRYVLMSKRNTVLFSTYMAAIFVGIYVVLAGLMKVEGIFNYVALVFLLLGSILILVAGHLSKSAEFD